MKFIAALAAVVSVSNAIDLAANSEVATATTADATATATAAVTATAGDGYSGPIVPENYNYAVHEFDLHAPFTDQECYEKQVDIYSDQIIAIEALRLEVLQLTQRITQAEHDFEHNAQHIAENKAKIHANSNKALRNKGLIDVLTLDVRDVGNCLSRQWDEQHTLRGVLELYCHQFTYTAQVPHQCQYILGGGSMLHAAYSWPADMHVDPHYHH